MARERCPRPVLHPFLEQVVERQVVNDLPGEAPCLDACLSEAHTRPGAEGEVAAIFLASSQHPRASTRGSHPQV